MEKVKALDAGKTAQVQFAQTQTNGLSFGIFNPISPKATRQGRAVILWKNFLRPNKPPNISACPSGRLNAGRRAANSSPYPPLPVTTSQKTGVTTLHAKLSWVTTSHSKFWIGCQLRSSNTSRNGVVGIGRRLAS